MKYRAKCTNCMAQMSCLYDERENPFVRDALDVYVEVDTEREAELIELLNDACFKAVRTYSKLFEIVNNFSLL